VVLQVIKHLLTIIAPSRGGEGRGGEGEGEDKTGLLGSSTLILIITLLDLWILFIMSVNQISGPEGSPAKKKKLIEQ
jgi:hypothetical protein